MKNFCYLAILILSVSCTISNVENRGFAFEDSDYDLLQEGITNKDMLLRIMGYPSFEINGDEQEAWLYYYEKEKKLLFMKPDVIDRRILLVSFDGTNVISELQHYNLEDENKKITFSNKKTVVPTHEVGMFKSFISNVGQVKAQ